MVLKFLTSLRKLGLARDLIELITEQLDQYNYAKLCVLISHIPPILFEGEYRTPDGLTIKLTTRENDNFFIDLEAFGPPRD